MPHLDRDSFVALLNQLGSDDDQEALTAARTIHQRVAEAGVTWDQLLLPAPSDEDDAVDHEEEIDEEEVDEGIDDDDEEEDYLDDDQIDPDEDDLTDSDEDALAEEDDRPTSGRASRSAKAAEDRSMIDRVLKNYDISPQTREDLEDLKQDLDEGEFTDDDRRYVQALEKRLRGR